MTRRKSGIKSMAIAVYAAMSVVALVWGGLRGLYADWWTFGSAGDVAAAVGLAAVLAGLAVTLSLQMERTVPGVQELATRFSSLLSGTTWRDALLLAGTSSVGEELLFRGCLQSELGIWPATLIFALVHSGPERVYLWWTASAFVFGLGLGLLYDAHGGLLAPIVMHFGINAVNITLLGRKSGEVKRRPALSLD